MTSGVRGSLLYFSPPPASVKCRSTLLVSRGVTRVPYSEHPFPPARLALLTAPFPFPSPARLLPSPRPLPPGAERLKASGNQALFEARWSAAVEAFTAALHLAPGAAVLYALRAGGRCRMHGRAVQCRTEALALDWTRGRRQGGQRA